MSSFVKLFRIFLVSISLEWIPITKALCPSNFLVQLPNGNCVHFSEGPVESYCDAQNSCQQINGELLKGESQLSSLFSLSNLPQLTDNIEYYIGLSVLYQDSNYISITSNIERRSYFRWTDGTLRNAETYWPSDEPNNLDSNESCGTVNDKDLNDNRCNRTINYICQPKTSGVPQTGDLFKLDGISAGSIIDGCFSDVFTNQTVRSCAMLCFKTPNCQSYYYNSATQECVQVLFTDSVSSSYTGENGWARYRGGN